MLKKSTLKLLALRRLKVSSSYLNFGWNKFLSILKLFLIKLAITYPIIEVIE